MTRERPNFPDALPEWELCGRIIGAFYETYNVLGFGFLELVYRNALQHELEDRGMRVESEKCVDVQFKGRRVGLYRLDLLVEGRVAVELKATAALGPADKRQLINYLRASTLDVGMLLHYGPKAFHMRVVSPRVIGGQQ